MAWGPGPEPVLAGSPSGVRSDGCSDSPGWWPQAGQGLAAAQGAGPPRSPGLVAGLAEAGGQSLMEVTRSRPCQWWPGKWHHGDVPKGHQEFTQGGPRGGDGRPGLCASLSVTDVPVSRPATSSVVAADAWAPAIREQPCPRGQRLALRLRYLLRSFCRAGDQTKGLGMTWWGCGCPQRARDHHAPSTAAHAPHPSRSGG